MTGLRRTSSTEAVRPPSPLSSDRQLRPMPHRSPSSADTDATVKMAPPARPQMVSRPSMSAFVSSHSKTKVGFRYAVEGDCLECMARARDAYDRMHAQHVKAEAEASGR